MVRDAFVSLQLSFSVCFFAQKWTWRANLFFKQNYLFLSRIFFQKKNYVLCASVIAQIDSLKLDKLFPIFYGRSFVMLVVNFCTLYLYCKYCISVWKWAVASSVWYRCFRPQEGSMLCKENNIFGYKKPSRLKLFMFCTKSGQRRAGNITVLSMITERSKLIELCFAFLLFLYPHTGLKRSLALSILSMLSSAKEKRIPEDNAARESYANCLSFIYSLWNSFCCFALWTRTASRLLPFRLSCQWKQ